MRNTKQLILMSIILILMSIIIGQVIIYKKKLKNSNYTIPIELLDKLIDEKLNVLKDKNAEDIYFLTEYCIKNDTKDSINKFIDASTSIISPLMKKNSVIFRNLNSKDEKCRSYSYKLIEYFILCNLYEQKMLHYYNFDLVQVEMFSNTICKNNILNLGEDFVGYIFLTVNDFENPFRVNIEGEKEKIMENASYIEYRRNSKTRGEQEIKGTLTFLDKGKEKSLEFSQKYMVK